MMKSERLKAAANLAPYVDTFSDVGSDHGYLATLLFSLKNQIFSWLPTRYEIRPLPHM